MGPSPSAPGAIASVRVEMDRATGLPKGYGFVQYYRHPQARSPPPPPLGSRLPIAEIRSSDSEHSFQFPISDFFLFSNRGEAVEGTFFLGYTESYATLLRSLPQKGKGSPSQPFGFFVSFTDTCQQLCYSSMV